MIYRSAWCIEGGQNHESRHDVTDQDDTRSASGFAKIAAHRKRPGEDQRPKGEEVPAPFGAKDAPQDRWTTLRDAVLRWAAEFHTNPRDEGKTCLFSSLAFFFLNYSPATAAGRRWRRSCTLERRPEDDCCHYHDPRARGPSRCHILAWPHVCKRVHANSRASGRANARGRSRIAFPYNRLRRFKCRDSIVYLIINFRMNYHLENASLRWILLFIRFLFHVRDR